MLKIIAVSTQITTLVVIICTLAVIWVMAGDIRDLVEMFREEQVSS